MQNDNEDTLTPHPAEEGVYRLYLRLWPDEYEQLHSEAKEAGIGVHRHIWTKLGLTKDRPPKYAPTIVRGEVKQSKELTEAMGRLTVLRLAFAGNSKTWVPFRDARAKSKMKLSIFMKILKELEVGGYVLHRRYDRAKRTQAEINITPSGHALGKELAASTRQYSSAVSQDSAPLASEHSDQ